MALLVNHGSGSLALPARVFSSDFPFPELNFCVRHSRPCVSYLLFNLLTVRNKEGLRGGHNWHETSIQCNLYKPLLPPHPITLNLAIVNRLAVCCNGTVTLKMCLIFITLLAINVLFSRAGPTTTQSDCQLDWNLCMASNDGGMSCYCDGSKQQQAYIHLTHCFANDNGQLTPRVKYAMS